MAEDDESEDEGPPVELGDGEPVEGAPIVRVASRLMWGMPKSEVVEREGDTTIRTPEGPQELGAVLEDVDETYFESRHEFVESVQDVVGTGPIPTGE